MIIILVIVISIGVFLLLDWGREVTTQAHLERMAMIEKGIMPKLYGEP